MSAPTPPADPPRHGDSPSPGRPPSQALYHPTPFEVLTQDLVWPMLFRAPGLALRPARIGLGAAGVLLIGLLWQLPGLTRSAPHKAPLLTLMADATDSDSLGRLADLAGQLSVWGWIALIISGVIAFILGGAIARSVALEFALRRRPRWPLMLRFALARAAPFAALVLLPALGLISAWLFIRIYGWAMLSLPGVNVLGGVLFVLPLAAGLLATLLCAALVLGLPMLAPSLACEGIDAIDSLQRTLAYVARRPVVLLAKLLLLGVLGAAMLGLAHFVADAAVAAIVPTALSTDAARQGLGPREPNAKPSWAQDTSWRLVHAWGQVPHLLLGGLAVSYFFSGGTLLYLSMRHACDRQDPEELWSHPTENEE